MYLQEDIKVVIQKMEKIFDSPVGIISDQTGLSRPTVSKFFHLQVLKPSSVEIIYENCLDLIEEKENKRKKIMERKDAIFKQAQ